MAASRARRLSWCRKSMCRTFNARPLTAAGTIAPETELSLMGRQLRGRRLVPTPRNGHATDRAKASGLCVLRMKCESRAENARRRIGHAIRLSVSGHSASPVARAREVDRASCVVRTVCAARVRPSCSFSISRLKGPSHAPNVTSTSRSTREVFLKNSMAGNCVQFMAREPASVLRAFPARLVCQRSNEALDAVTPKRRSTSSRSGTTNTEAGSSR